MSWRGTSREIRNFAWLVLPVAVLVSACTAVKPIESSGPRLVPLSRDECVALMRDDSSQESLLRAISVSEGYLAQLPPERQLVIVDRKVTVADLSSVVGAMREMLASGGDLADACGRFLAFRAELGGDLLVTGYYEPEVAASRSRTERFKYPLYRVPYDLIEVDLAALCKDCPPRKIYGRVREHDFVPYYSRAQIDAGSLAGKDNELAWLDDPIEVFFLHIQGSATLRLDDGTEMQVSYAGSNDRPYTSIGRKLVDEGKMDRAAASLQGLKAYLRGHPEEQAAIMAANERYIFFRTVAAGPIGSLGVPLTPGRSVAADRDVYAPGALVFMRIYDGGGANVEYSRFALIQDAGIAIQGPRRLDAFWGTGAEGERIAGPMRNRGELFFLLPR